MSNRMIVVHPIPNDCWSGLNEICFMGVYDSRILTAICVQEPEEGKGYEEEVLRIVHTDTLTGVSTTIGYTTGQGFRDDYNSLHFDELVVKGFELSELQTSIQPYLIEFDEKLVMPKVILVMEGGLIQNVIADTAVDLTIIDRDTEGADEDELRQVYGDDAYVSGPHVNVNPEEVEVILNMIKASDEEDEE